MRMGWMVCAVAIWLIGTPRRAGADELPANPLRIPSSPQTTLQLTEQSTPTIPDQLASAYTTPKAVAAFLHKAFTFERDEELLVRRTVGSRLRNLWRAKPATVKIMPC